ncbi:MAG: YicC/YloC family endoribonuclease [Candidatus Hydrogenedentales bacterium]
MAFSMTGFARYESVIAGETMVIEISSVNHRFLDLNFRLPFQWIILEPELRNIAKAVISRGKVYVTVRHFKGPAVTCPPRLDVERANAYIEAARELMHLMRSTESLSLDTLISMDGVLTVEEPETDLSLVKEELTKAVKEVLALFNEVRLKEGTALLADMEEQLCLLEQLVSKIELRAPELQSEYEQKLKQRIADINAEVGVKEERLALEVAIMAERMDVTEELVRLKAHIAHSRDMLSSEGSIGRDLNFLMQEMQREVNTLGAKLRDVAVNRDTIEMKAAIEKMREQIQNIE